MFVWHCDCPKWQLSFYDAHSMICCVQNNSEVVIALVSTTWLVCISMFLLWNSLCVPVCILYNIPHEIYIQPLVLTIQGVLCTIYVLCLHKKRTYTRAHFFSLLSSLRLKLFLWNLCFSPISVCLSLLDSTTAKNSKRRNTHRNLKMCISYYTYVGCIKRKLAKQNNERIIFLFFFVCCIFFLYISTILTSKPICCQ